LYANVGVQGGLSWAAPTPGPDQILAHWAEHELDHLEQIRAALRA